MILVTGVNGFIGKHLLGNLISRFGKDNILALSSKPISECNFLLHNNYTFEDDLFIKNGYSQIDTLIHGGAFTPKSSLDANELKGSTSNVVNTSKLLRATLPGLEKIIYLSAIDVYPVSDNVIDEASPTDPESLYGFSKLFCEKMVIEWASQNKLICQILRIGHIYGPGEEQYKKLIPAVMNRIINGDSVQIMGKGEDIRTYLYVTDLVDCILNSLRLTEPIGPVNIVGNESITVHELISKMITISGMNVPVSRIDEISNSRNLVFNNTRMKKYLSSPVIELDEGLLNEWNYMKALNQ